MSDNYCPVNTSGCDRADRESEMGEQIKDGGPAFPEEGRCSGMTLRDYFAARVIQGLYSMEGEGFYPTEASNGKLIGKGSGGMDVKWGVNESFTLDATLVPDF